MNKIYYILILYFLLISASCSDKENNSFVLEGKLENLTRSYILLTREVVNDSLQIDTIKVDDKGYFSFKGKADSLEIAYLFPKENSSPLTVFLDKNQTIKISGDANKVYRIEVKGGQVNNDLTSFKKENTALFESRMKLIEQSKKDSLKNVLSNEFKNVNFQIMTKSKEYILNNPTKIVSSVLAYRFYRNPEFVDALDEILNILEGDAKSFYLTRNMEEYSEYVKKSMVGAEAPHFSLPDRDGVNKSLSQYRGKYAVLSFVSTTCKFCNEEWPYLKEAFDKLAKQKENFVFITIFIDSHKNAVREQTENYPKNWIVLIDSKEWAAETIKSYNINQIPYHILISPDGKILARGLNLLTLPEKLTELKSRDKE